MLPINNPLSLSPFLFSHINFLFTFLSCYFILIYMDFYKKLLANIVDNITTIIRLGNLTLILDGAQVYVYN